jgi:putative DNA primase/helicase
MTLPTQAEANEDFFSRSKREWAGNGGFPGARATGSVSSGCTEPRRIESVEWPDPKPLDDALPSVESFAPELLPDALRGWVMDVTERTQAPAEYVAVSAMVSLGAALGRKIAVRPKRLDDWCEFGNLWAAVVGPPSWMKSPALDEGKRPLTIIEARELEGFETTHRVWEADEAAARVQRDGARDRARKAARDRTAFDKMELVAQPIPDEPKPPRLIVNDATVPALCEVLRTNPDGVLVFRDELSGLIAELDREGMEGSRGFYLTGWSGKDGYTQDRILRGTNLRVPYVCLSVLGGIQPSRVAPLLRDSIATGGSDGFLARFSLTVWPNSPGEYRNIDRHPNEAARRAGYEVYERLHTLCPENVGAELVDGMAPFLRLDPAAAEAFTAWDVELRNRLRCDIEDAPLAAHLGKYPKTVCALALLSHLADGGSGAITEGAIMRALAWAEFLESHARRLYASLGQAHIEAARSLLKRLRRGDLSSPFTLREVYRRGWAHLPDAEAARAAVDMLEVKGWVRSNAIESGQFGGRPSAEYFVHPSVLSS